MKHPDIPFERLGQEQEVAVIRLTRSTKRNTLNDVLESRAAQIHKQD